MLRKLLFIFVLSIFHPMFSSSGLTLAADSLAIPTDSLSKEPRVFRIGLEKDYNRPEFDYSTKEPVASIWERLMLWLSDWLGRLFDVGGNQSVKVITVTFKVLAVLILVIAVYLIAKSLYQKNDGRQKDALIHPSAGIEEELKRSDFEQLIEKTLQNGDNRLAIRYYYLWFLKKLSDREIIVWDKEKTDSDYLYEIKQPQLQKNFAYLSYLYNHIWYGEFTPDSKGFEKARSAFKNSINSLK